MLYPWSRSDVEGVSVGNFGKKRKCLTENRSKFMRCVRVAMYFFHSPISFLLHRKEGSSNFIPPYNCQVPPHEIMAARNRAKFSIKSYSVEVSFVFSMNFVFVQISMCSSSHPRSTGSSCASFKVHRPEATVQGRQMVVMASSRLVCPVPSCNGCINTVYEIHWLSKEGKGLVLMNAGKRNLIWDILCNILW